MPMNEDTKRTSRGRIYALAALLLFLAVLKLQFNPAPTGAHGRDGSIYFQVARHVAEGDGFVTSVALYHQGFKQLPHATNIHPLWPLLLGLTGRLIGMGRAASALPEVLYFVALVLVYLLGNALDRTLGGGSAPRRAGFIGTGHVCVLLLGLNGVFFKFSSLPFTESLAFSIMFAMILALDACRESRHVVAWGALAGGLAAAAYLTRAQLLGLLVVPATALALVGIKRRTYLVAAGAASAVAIVAVAPWVLYLRQLAGGFSPELLVDFSALRETPELARLPIVVPADSITDFLLDRAHGVWVAFHPLTTNGYVESFGGVVYLVPLSVVWLLARPERLRRAATAATDARSLVAVASILGGLAAVLPVHAFHTLRNMLWYFAFRHGLPMIVLIAVALAWVGAFGGRVLKGVAALLLVWSAVYAGTNVASEFRARSSYTGPTVAEHELAAWIETQGEPPTFVTTMPWELGSATRGRFHAIWCYEPATQLAIYLDRVGVDTVAVKGRHLTCPVLRDPGHQLVKVVEFGSGPERIVVLRPAGDSER